MIVVDSGLGGLSVVRALREVQPSIALRYLADTTGFPYGDRDAAWVRTRADQLVTALAIAAQKEVVVLACNTLSTLALESLRQHWPHSFVGTVPAIKVAAEQSKTRRFTLLATPNTSHGAYVTDLIAQFAAQCVVDCYGAPKLASYAERILLGENVPDEMVRAEIAPCFHNDARGRTDMVILGCTHYPLIIESLERAAPWNVGWIDSSPAIARRALTQSEAKQGASVAYVTRREDIARYEAIFAAEGFTRTESLALT